MPEEIDQADRGAACDRGTECDPDPSSPRPARCGFDVVDPGAHTTAEMISARTARISPIGMVAPTMSRSWAMRGKPLELGLMSISDASSSYFGRDVEAQLGLQG